MLDFFRLDMEHFCSSFVSSGRPKIPLLLQLGQEPQALTRAVESGDPNLIYQVSHLIDFLGVDPLMLGLFVLFASPLSL